MRTITVTGRAGVTAVPDSAVVRIAAVHRAPVLADAVAGCDSAVRAAVEAATRHVERRLVGSRGVRVDQPWRHERPDGYEASHSVTINCPDLDTASALLADLAAEVGDRLRVEGVSLTVSDATDAQREARKAAYDDAVRQATELAEHAGCELGPVQAIGEADFHGGPMLRAAADSAKMSLEPGETEISESLTVTFELV